MSKSIQNLSPDERQKAITDACINLKKYTPDSKEYKTNLRLLELLQKGQKQEQENVYDINLETED